LVESNNRAWGGKRSPRLAGICIQMGEDVRDDHRVLGAGDDARRPGAGWAGPDVDTKNSRWLSAAQGNSSRSCVPA